MGIVELATGTAAVCGGVTAVIGTSAVLWRIERRVRRVATRVLGDEATPGALDRLDEIWREMRPNGGSSLRDVVDRLEARQDRADRALAAHLAAPHP